MRNLARYGRRADWPRTNIIAVGWLLLRPTTTWCWTEVGSGPGRPTPRPLVVVHPEARQELLDAADAVTSTSGMVRMAEENQALILGTERGIVDQLRNRFPDKTFVPLSGAAICGNMKLNTLAKLAWSLDHGRHEVLLDEEIRVRAEASLRRMLDLSGGWVPSTQTAEEESLELAGVRPRGCGCA